MVIGVHGRHMEIVHKLVEEESKGEIVHVTILYLFMVEHLVMDRLLPPEVAMQIRVQVYCFSAFSISLWDRKKEITARRFDQFTFLEMQKLL